MKTDVQEWRKADALRDLQDAIEDLFSASTLLRAAGESAASETAARLAVEVVNFRITVVRS